MSDSVTFTIDGITATVPKGTTVYTAAKQLGLDLPIFCYQDRMPPFGACRVCLVEVEKMPKLQTSCTLEATEGMVVRTQSAPAVQGRESIIEFLLINHPLDCPICDRGGECPLQENTLRYGNGLSRFFEEKRHFEKPIALGPVLMLDRERCIACARCTRFGDIIAGDHALEFINRGFRTEVGTPDGRPVESKFIGNTIMICPVGALTSQVYRFRARPWDNDPTPTTCTLCPVGCSMILDARDGEVMRTRSLENRDVNDIWMCDKGWFGYEFIASDERLATPLVRKNDALTPVSWDEALSLIAVKLNEAKTGKQLGALGGNPLTTEENYLFQKLIRTVSEENHVDHRVGMPLFNRTEEGLQSGMEISIGACESLKTIYLLGLDLTEEFPVIWLRIKQAMNKGASCYFIGHYAPEISSLLTKTFLHAPGQEVAQIEKVFEQEKCEGPSGVFIGSQYLNSPNRLNILNAVQTAVRKTDNISLNLLEGKGNSFGARLAGMRPDIGPGNKELINKGLNAAELLETAAKSGWDLLYVAGADPASKYPDALWKAVRQRLGFLVVQDLFLTKTAADADVVLPTLSFAEKGGHFINIEGRVSQIAPGKEIPGNLMSDAEIFRTLGQKLGIDISLDAHFANMLIPGTVHKPTREPLANIARPKVDSGGTLGASFSPALFDHGVRMQHNSHVKKLVKEARVRIHPLEASKRGIKEGDPIRISCEGNSIEAKVHLDHKVAGGTAVIPVGFDDIPVRNLAECLYNGLKVEIERLP